MRHGHWSVRALGVCALAAAALALPLAASAGDSPGGKSKHTGEVSGARDKLAFFDSRDTPAARATLRERAARLAGAPAPAVTALQDSLGPQGLVSIDPLTSTPRLVGRLDGFLTAPSSRSADSIAIGYVAQNADAFGVDSQTVRDLTLVRDYVDIDGTHHLFYVQKANGLPVFGNGLKANVTKDGRLINVLGSPVADPSIGSTAPRISSTTAVASARSDAEESVPPVRALPGENAKSVVFSNGDNATLVLFQGVDGLRLAWQTTVSGSGVAFTHVIDAGTGQVLYRRSLVNYGNALVYDNYPGAAVGGTAVTRSLTAPGWLPSSAATLNGNNAHAYTDLDDSNDTSDVNGDPEEIDPSGGGNFLYPVTPFTFAGPLNAIYGCDTSLCTWNPSFDGDPGSGDPSGDYSFLVNRAQSGAQLFYLVNKYHDHLLGSPIGFTEAAGNFQLVNSTHKGLGGDALQAEAMDGGNSYGFGFPDPNHTDNANMETPPDGTSPRMQMYLWHDTTTDALVGPDADPFLPADGADEADIVYHEYTHGLSNRLVVDPLGNSTLGNVQAGSMGEAWSDWYAFDYLVKDGYFTDTSAPGDLLVGTYVSKGLDLIRTQPLDCPVGTASAKCPGTPGAGPGGYTYGDFGTIIGRPEVHADGEIWGETLWDLRTAFGKKGWKKAESLITRAMELSPANPSYLDMRNAILQADLVAGGGSQSTIWSVFAHRGMGYFAGTVDGDDTRPVEDFSMPPGGKAKSKLVGTVTDRDTGVPISGALVAFGGHDSGFGGNLAAVSAADGSYSVDKIIAGTYPKVNASAPGFDTAVATVTIPNKATATANWTLRRDWAALAGGGSIDGFNGPDYTDFGCGPPGAIDQSGGSGWGSTTDNDDGDATGSVTPKFVIVKLPASTDVSEIAVDPAAACGDPGSSSTRGYRVETSTDGVTYTPLVSGVFYLANRNQLNSVFSGTVAGVRYVKFWMLNPQVPTAADPDSSCTGTSDCGTDPNDDSGVTLHCSPGADNAFGGCQFMDMSEIEVYGRPS